MKRMVRSVGNAIVPTGTRDGTIGKGDELLAPVPHEKDGLSVVSQRFLGADPGVRLTWSTARRYWRQGYRLMGFRSTSGIAVDPHPADLGAHGLMILEETADGGLEERLPEGTHFYTFVLHKEKWFRTREAMAVVRFSESIPSARTAIGRIEDQLKLRQLGEAHDLQAIKGQVARNEAIIALHNSNRKLAALTEKTDDSVEGQVRRDVESVVREKLKRAMTRVELAIALQDVQEQLKRNPAWGRLDERQRERVLNDVLGDLDAEEEFFQP